MCLLMINCMCRTLCVYQNTLPKNVTNTWHHNICKIQETFIIHMDLINNRSNNHWYIVKFIHITILISNKNHLQHWHSYLPLQLVTMCGWLKILNGKYSPLCTEILGKLNVWLFDVVLGLVPEIWVWLHHQSNVGFFYLLRLFRP